MDLGVAYAAGGGLVEPTPGVVAASDAVRAAWLRFYTADAWWSALRAAWEVLRRFGPQTSDPRATGGLLAAIENAADVAPGVWRNYGPGTTEGPWPTSRRHVWLAWVVLNGGRPWLPTAEQQDAAYTALAPAPDTRADRLRRSPLLPTTAPRQRSSPPAHHLSACRSRHTTSR